MHILVSICAGLAEHMSELCRTYVDSTVQYGACMHACVCVCVCVFAYPVTVSMPLIAALPGLLLPLTFLIWVAEDLPRMLYNDTHTHTHTALLSATPPWRLRFVCV